MPNPADNTPITRHATIDRAFHWITALCVIVLLASAYLPLRADSGWRLGLHWSTGVVLTGAVLFHLVRSLFFKRPRCMALGARDVRDARAGRLAAKYTPGQKLMHALLGAAVLVLVVTGVPLLASIDTPFWGRRPYLLSPEAWNTLAAWHAAAALACLVLTLVHVALALLPRQRAYLRAMVRGQMTRAEAARFHDPARWAGHRRDDPGESRR